MFGSYRPLSHRMYIVLGYCILGYTLLLNTMTQTHKLYDVMV
jgi:hypothetical protein